MPDTTEEDRFNLEDRSEEDEYVNPEGDTPWVWAMDFDPSAGEYNVFLTDQNRIELPPGSRKAACTGARVILNNSFAKLPVVGHTYATSHFIGRGPTEIAFRFESIGSEFLSSIQSMMEELEHNSREFRRIRGAGRVTLDNNELLALCGIQDGIISGFDTRTSEAGTDLYEGNLSLTSDGHHNESFQQEAYSDSGLLREVAEGLLEWLQIRRIINRTNSEEGLQALEARRDLADAEREARETLSSPLVVASPWALGSAASTILHANAVRAMRMINDLRGARSGVEGLDDATTMQEVAQATSDTALQIAQELVVSLATEGSPTSNTWRTLSDRTIRTFPIVPDHNPREYVTASYSRLPLAGERDWLIPYVTELQRVFEEKGDAIPVHDFFVGEHRGAYRDYTPRSDTTTMQRRASNGEARMFVAWPDIFKNIGESPSPFSEKMFGRRRGFRSVTALQQHLVDFQEQVYRIAQQVIRDHSGSDEFGAAFPGLVDRIVASRNVTTNTTYPDLHLPEHPATGLVTDTEPDFYFFNDGEEGMLNEIGPEIAEEADARLEAMESSFTRLASGNTFFETYLGRSRTGVNVEDRVTLTGREPDAMEGAPGGITVDPAGQQTHRLMGTDSNDSSSVINVAMGISSQVQAGPHGADRDYDQIRARREEMFRNSTLALPSSDNPRAMSVGPINSALGVSDRSHSFSRNHLRGIVEQSVVQNADKTLTMRRAFPSFKIYFIEDDIGPQREHLLSRNATMYFDDLYNYNSVKSIRLIRSRKIPTDLLILELTNVQGLLERRRWVANPEMDRELYTPGFEETELENPLKKILLKEGLKVQARLGYTSDANKMTIKFIGEVVEYSFNAESSDEVTIICQSYGSELVADLKGGTGGSANFRDTPDTCHTLMCSPELVHFGRFNLNPDFNPAEARSQATSRGVGERAFGIIPDWRNVLDVGRELITRNRSQWILANNPADDNIYAPSLLDYLSFWDRWSSIVGNNIMWQVGILDELAGVDRNESWLTTARRMVFNPSQVGGNLRGIAGFGQRLVGAAWLAVGDMLSSTNYDVPSGTIWEIFKEMELRHPGWIAHPRPYGTRMTMFFGSPDQRYWADQITLEEMTILRQVSEQLDESWLRSEAGQRMQREQIEAFLRFREAGRRATTYRAVGNLSEVNVNMNSGGLGTASALGVWALGPLYRTSLLRLQHSIRHQRMLSEVGEFLGRTHGRFRPFRRHHLITSDHHLLMNNIRASEKGTFNCINLQYGGGDVYTLKADDSIPDEKVRVQNASFPACDNETLARRYCAGLLARHLKDVYKGEIVVTGMDIDPYDIFYLHDDRSGMYGACEVEQVVDTFTPQTGWITEITPDMIVGINHWSTIGTGQAMNAILGTLYRRYSRNYGTGLAVAGLSAAALSSAVIPAAPLVTGAGAYMLYLGGMHVIRWTQDRQPLWISPLIFGERPFFSGLDGFRQDGVFTSLRGRLHAEINALSDGWRAFHLAGYLNDFTIGIAQQVSGQAGT